jgi:hypothetical protein
MIAMMGMAPGSCPIFGRIRLDFRRMAQPMWKFTDLSHSGSGGVVHAAATMKSGRPYPWTALPRGAPLLLLGGAAGTGAAALAFACGGTSGREDVPMMPGTDAGASDVTLAGDADLDATLYDVGFVPDRMLPDIAPPPPPKEGGGGSQWPYPWPQCPPWVDVTYKGVPSQCDGAAGCALELDNQAPATFDDAGNLVLNDAGAIVPPPDGSPCGSYPWLGSTDIDNCVATWFANLPTISTLPPCNWCAEAGAAKAGPGAGSPRYDLCQQLYGCIVDSGCGQKTPGYCLCGPDTANCDASGPCAAYELASLETIPTDPGFSEVLANYASAIPSKPYFCGAALNDVFSTLTNSSCAPLLPDK